MMFRDLLTTTRPVGVAEKLRPPVTSLLRSTDCARRTELSVRAFVRLSLVFLPLRGFSSLMFLEGSRDRADGWKGVVSTRRSDDEAAWPACGVLVLESRAASLDWVAGGAFGLAFAVADVACEPLARGSTPVAA